MKETIKSGLIAATVALACGTYFFMSGIVLKESSNEKYAWFVFLLVMAFVTGIVGKTIHDEVTQD